MEAGARVADPQGYLPIFPVLNAIIVEKVVYISNLNLDYGHRQLMCRLVQGGKEQENARAVVIEHVNNTANNKYYYIWILKKLPQK